jgi:hypothetical protein
VGSHALRNFLTPLQALLFTSRPEHDLVAAFKKSKNIFGSEFEISEESNQRDIISYLRRRLEDIRSSDDELLAPDWPGEQTIAQLSMRSAGLFVWCSTAMIFIEKGLDPDERLEILLQAEFRTKAESALEDLYTVALQNSGLWEGKSFANDFRAFLGIILVSKEPLLHSTIDGLLGRGARNPAFWLRSTLGDSRTRSHLAPSSADFLSNRTRCKKDLWSPSTPATSLFDPLKF